MIRDIMRDTLRTDNITDEDTKDKGISQAAKRMTKDSVFRDLFEDPKYLLQLYQALHPEDTDTTEDQITSVTIKNVLLDQLYNDLGFLVGSRLLLLIEAQSTWSVNIVVRVLMYLANTWKEYIENQKLNMYGSKKLELPRPELYVVYTGDRKERPEWLSLSEDFFAGQDTFVDVKVKMIYDGRKGDIINQYVTFTRVYDEQVRRHGRTREAVLETIRICRDQDVLAKYLESREKEVLDIMMTLFDQEYAMMAWGKEKMEEGEAKGRAEGRAEGEAKGRAEGEAKGKLQEKQKTAYKLADRKMPVETISDIVEVSIDTVKQWLAERPAGV